MATCKTNGMALLKLDFATLRVPGGRCQLSSKPPSPKVVTGPTLREDGVSMTDGKNSGMDRSHLFGPAARSRYSELMRADTRSRMHIE